METKSTQFITDGPCTKSGLLVGVLLSLDRAEVAHHDLHADSNAT